MPTATTIDSVKKFLEENDKEHYCTLLSTDYVDSGTPLKFKCNLCGGTFERTYSSLRQKRFKCTKCAAGGLKFRKGFAYRNPKSAGRASNKQRSDYTMELTANAIQTVAENANVQFTETVVEGKCSIGHRVGSGLITLRGNTNQCRARYLVSFGGNITVADGGTVGPVTVALSLDGEALGSATAIVTPAAIGDYFNVYVSAYIDVPRGCCLTVSAKNLSPTAIDVQNANLIATRVA